MCLEVEFSIQEEVLRMKKPRFRESEIFQVLKEAEAGIPVPELCRNHGMSNASF